MGLFTVTNWPLVAISVGMIVAAVIDGWKLKVPNKLTFPLILSGWLLGGLYDLGWLGRSATPAGESFFAASLLGTAIGFLVLFPLYAIGGMGAGDVKMEMGFGAWIGAFLGVNQGLWVILYAFAAGAIVGGILAAGMILARAEFRRNWQNAREILTDLVRSSGVGEVAQKAAERKSRLRLLPYGIPLCIGNVGYLIYYYSNQAV